MYPIEKVETSSKEQVCPLCWSSDAYRQRYRVKLKHDNKIVYKMRYVCRNCGFNDTYDDGEEK